MERKLICVQCPIGCHLTVTYDGVHEPVVTGNTCKNGEIYGKSEVTDPRRTLTTSVRIKGGTVPVSVRSAQPIPKAVLPQCLEILHKTMLEKGSKAGTVVVPNILDTGIDIVTTRDDWN